MLWDLLQNRQISEARRTAVQAASAAGKTRTDIAEIRHNLESLSLTCQAMWELLREREGFTDETLMQKMQEIDLRDGQADGKMTRTVVNCPACSRINHCRHETCMYCGVDLPGSGHVFAQG